MTRNLLGIVMLFAAVGSAPAGETVKERIVWEKDYMSFDRAEWDYSRPLFHKGRSGKTEFHNSGWAEFDLKVPDTGWYELYIGGFGGLTHKLYVDGKLVYFGGLPRNPSDSELPGTDFKSTNLPLVAGKHTIRFERLGRIGFPHRIPKTLKLLRARDVPSHTIYARKAGHDALRLGEPFRIEVTGSGCPIETSYDLYVKSLFTGDEWKAATVSFAPGEVFQNKIVEIGNCPEGVYQVRCQTKGAWLSGAEFRIDEFSVINTAESPTIGNKEEKRLIHDLDCVNNTLDGKPLLADSFFEGLGESRINRCAGKSYRETANGLGEAAKGTNGFAAIAYRFELGESQGPYLLEIDYPDDDYRHANILIIDYDDSKNRTIGFSQAGAGYLTGGLLPLSQSMKTLRAVFWTNHPKIHLTLFSAKKGYRAAASRIRIYSFEKGLPPRNPARKNGRICASWSEQQDDWDLMVAVRPLRGKMPLIQSDFIGYKRWIELTAYAGMNAISPTDISYQNAMHRTEVLKGYMPRPFDSMRMGTLLCEKYRMKYFPEMLIEQQHFNHRVLDRASPNYADVRSTNFLGDMGPYNVLNPGVQKIMIDVFGEIADILGDSPAFGGISCRINTWQWQGLYSFSSIYWGYGDLIVTRFEKDTAIDVPGNPDDPDRFRKRYDFLTSKKVRERWIAWRTEQVLEYLIRIRDRIRQTNPNAVLLLCGDGFCEGVLDRDQLPDSTAERFLQMGLDSERLATIEGIVLAPENKYGRGKIRTHLKEQENYDRFLDPEHLRAGYGHIRASVFYNMYDEWMSDMPWKEYGCPLPKGHHVGASDAWGRDQLERYAVALAEQDTMFFRDGGYGYTYGDRQIRGEWLSEYSQLPFKPFTPLLEARDPIAVWYRECEDGFYFYAVNRERYSIPFTLSLEGTSQVTRLGTAMAQQLDEGKLVLDLNSYELAAFKAPIGTRIRTTHATVSDERIDELKHFLAYVQMLQKNINSGVLKGVVDNSLRTSFGKILNDAWVAFQKTHYWRSRTLLTRHEMMAVYEQTGEMPEQQFDAKFPGLLRFETADRYTPDDPFLDGNALMATVSEGSSTKLIQSKSYNPEWLFYPVVRAEEKSLTLDIPLPAPGFYRMSVGHVAPTLGVITATINGESLPIPITTEQVNIPETTVFPVIYLQGNLANLTLSKESTFGVYAIKLVPVLDPLPTNLWWSVGAFQSKSSELRDANPIKAEMQNDFGPESNSDLDEIYENAKGEQVGWSRRSEAIGRFEDHGVNFRFRQSQNRRWGTCYAQTFVQSPDDRTAVIALGTDWWANLYVNGDLVEVAGSESTFNEFGCHFNRWKPRVAKIQLKKGVNRILVKNHGGSRDNWFVFYINKQKGLEISPEF